MNAQVTSKSTGAPQPPTDTPIVAIRDLSVEFHSANGEQFTAVQGVDLTIGKGEIVALVGESGSGKSLTARSILRLIPSPGRIKSGEILVQGKDIRRFNGNQIRQLRGKVAAMIFQDPMTALNPVQRVGNQIAEIITLHKKTNRPSLLQRVHSLLSKVGITNPEARAASFPHEYSGGMRQRAMIAMGVANNPVLLIADEPTTALDVTVQDQIMALMRELNRDAGTAILLISHNLAVVASLCSRVMVMYAGRVVEEAPVETIFSAPQHPYTWSLLQSIPRIDHSTGDRLMAIPGQPPNPRDLPGGCKFHPRCRFALDQCKEQEPPLENIAPQHSVRCWVQMRNVPEGAQ